MNTVRLENGISKDRVSGFIDHSSVFFNRISSNDKCRISKRYSMALMMFLGLFILYWMRNNFIIAVLHIMANKKDSGDVLDLTNYDWASDKLILADASFYWGYTIGQIPGAILVIYYSAHRLMGISIATACVLHLLLPLVINFHFGAVITVNLLQGISEGPVYAACFGMLVQWVPKMEKARLVTLSLTGIFTGNLVGIFISSTLVEHLGREIGVFAAGVSGLLWCTLWSNFVYESPSQDPTISQAELLYLDENVSPEARSSITMRSIPWKSIFTSGPVLVLFFIHFVAGCCSCIAEDIPYFFYHVQYTQLSQYLYAIPHILLTAFIPLSGLLSDFLTNKGDVSVSVIRKIFCSGAYLVHAVFIILLVFFPGLSIPVICLQFAAGVLGFTITNSAVNYLDLCPRYVVILAGLSKTFYALGEVGFAMTMEYVVHNNLHGQIGFFIIFICVAILSIIGALLFAIFGSGEEQEWAISAPGCGSELSAVQRDSVDYYPKSDADEDAMLVTENL